MAKNIVSTPLNVEVTLRCEVRDANSTSWNDPRGDANFQVTLPVESIKAVDLTVLLPGLLAQAVAKWGMKQAEAEIEAQAEAERVRIEAEAQAF